MMLPVFQFNDDCPYKIGLYISSSIPSIHLSADDRICLDLLHQHGVDSHKLKKLIDQSVNQADSIIAEYERTKTMPALLAKAFINGVFSGTVTHTNERDQRAVQIQPLQQLVDNEGRGNGQTPSYFIDDSYLGEGNGIQSRLASIQKRKAKAEANLKKVKHILHDSAPRILESVADSIKETGSKYNRLFSLLDKNVMKEVSDLVQGLLSTASDGGVGKSLQPESKHYPHLSDRDSPLYMIPLLKDAQNAKKRLDAFVVDIVKGVKGVEPKFAPLKSVERALVKVYEKYDCRFDMLTDMARVTVVCVDEHALKNILTKLKAAVDDEITRISRIKFRLDEEFDAMEAGGYRDILVNLAFPPQEDKENEHIVELQLNLEKFVEVKSGGGHASYTVGRMLQAFDTAAVTYTGYANPDSVRDIQTGLVKKATIVGLHDLETESRIVKALGSHSVQLVELKLLNVKFESGLGDLAWLSVSAEHLAPTLKVLQINSCGVKGQIPGEVRLLCNLVHLNLADNQLEGASKEYF